MLSHVCQLKSRSSSHTLTTTGQRSTQRLTWGRPVDWVMSSGLGNVQWPGGHPVDSGMSSGLGDVQWTCLFQTSRATGVRRAPLLHCKAVPEQVTSLKDQSGH